MTTLRMVAGDADRFETYAVHGRGVTSVRLGLAEIAMPVARQRAAEELLAELVAVNDADGFVWYLPPATPELACYWNGASTNLLWITTIGLGGTTLAARARSHSTDD